MIASIHMVLIITASVGAIFAARHAVRRAVDAVALIVLTFALGLPVWITCDRYLLTVTPAVWWFDPSEPFAPYFLLYLPLSSGRSAIDWMVGVWCPSPRQATDHHSPTDSLPRIRFTCMAPSPMQVAMLPTGSRGVSA